MSTDARRPLLWDVDTQVDFVHAYGKLAVPHAADAVSAMERLVQWARETGVVHLATVDDHELTDSEISGAPDLESTFPPHCLRGTPGAAKILETRQADPVPIPLARLDPLLVRELVSGQRELLVLKQSFDAFTNPNLDGLLDALDPSEAIVFGVATDVCDDAAITGLLRRGRSVAFVEDASRGLSKDRVAACLARWREAGVRFTTSEEVVALNGRGDSARASVGMETAARNAG